MICFIFLKFPGMRLTLNTTSNKVDSIFVKVGEEFEPLDYDREYQVTTMKFLLEGGNGFKVGLVFKSHYLSTRVKHLLSSNLSICPIIGHGPVLKQNNADCNVFGQCSSLRPEI